MHLTFLIPYFVLGLVSVVLGAPYNTVGANLPGVWFRSDDVQFSNGLEARLPASTPRTVFTITLSGPRPANWKEVKWVEEGVEKLLDNARIINQEDPSSHSNSEDASLLPEEKLVWKYKPKGPAIVISQFTFTFTGSTQCGGSACSGEVKQFCHSEGCEFLSGTVKDGKGKQIYSKKVKFVLGHIWSQ